MRKESIEELRVYAKTHSLSQTAEYFGYCNGYISKIAKENGVYFIHHDRYREVKEFIHSNYLEMTSTQIAEYFKIPKDKVLRIFRDLKIRPLESALKKKVGKKKDRNEMIQCLIDNGFTYQSVGDVFGLTRARIEQLVDKTQKIKGTENGS